MADSSWGRVKSVALSCSVISSVMRFPAESSASGDAKITVYHVLTLLIVQSVIFILA